MLSQHFCFNFYEISFYLPFTFSLCVAFNLRWVSESCFLIRSAALYLLIEAFNLFLLNIIIDRYAFIAILLFIFMFLFFLFPLIEAPLTFLLILVCLVINSFRFFLSGKHFVSSSILHNSWGELLFLQFFVFNFFYFLKDFMYF